MSGTDEVVRQTVLVADIVRRQPGIGRTALMKYVYLLQAVKGVDLGFDFTIYSYGPYDAAVLSRVAMGVRWGAITERTVQFPSGTGYELREGGAVEDVVDLDRDFLAEHKESIEWVVQRFGGYNAASMELIATMVFADRESKGTGEPMSKTALIERVLKIKPKFAYDQVESLYETLKDELELGGSGFSATN